MVQGSYLCARNLGVLFVHMEFVHCNWMTAIKANHQVGLTINSGAIGPWSELMVSKPDQLAKNAHYCQPWSHWLLVVWEVQCTYLFLSVVGTEFQPQLLWP